MAPLDTAAVAEMHDALCGGGWAGRAARQAAAAVEASAPGTGRLLRQARAFHARAAEWAVTEGGAAGVVFAACGYPPDQMPHLAAARAAPSARFAYCDPDLAVAAVLRDVLGSPLRAAVAVASARDPGRLLSMPQVRAAGAPLMVQLQLAVHFWAPEEAREVIAGYGRLLRRRAPGSLLALSVAVSPRDRAAREAGRAYAAAVSGPVHYHGRDDIAGWLDAAGMTLAGPVQDARAWPDGTWADPRLGRPGRGQMIAAVARVP